MRMPQTLAQHWIKIANRCVQMFCLDLRSRPPLFPDTNSVLDKHFLRLHVHNLVGIATPKKVSSSRISADTLPAPSPPPLSWKTPSPFPGFSMKKKTFPSPKQKKLKISETSTKISMSQPSRTWTKLHLPHQRTHCKQTHLPYHLSFRSCAPANLEGPTRKPRHASVFSTHSDTQAAPAFHCRRMFKGMFFDTLAFLKRCLPMLKEASDIISTRRRF